MVIDEQSETYNYMVETERIPQKDEHIDRKSTVHQNC